MGSSLERIIKRKACLIYLNQESWLKVLKKYKKNGLGKTETFFFSIKITYFKSAIYMPTTLPSLSRARITSSSR